MLQNLPLSIFIAGSVIVICSQCFWARRHCNKLGLSKPICDLMGYLFVNWVVLGIIALYVGVAAHPVIKSIAIVPQTAVSVSIIWQSLDHLMDLPTDTHEGRLIIFQSIAFSVVLMLISIAQLYLILNG